MPRLCLSAFAGLCAAFLAACGNANGAPDPRPWDEVIREDGLAAAEATLAAREQDAETAFLLGGVRFLRAAEHIMQVRYNNYEGALPMLPGMRNTLPESNPDGRFDPAFLETAMRGALAHLSEAQAALGPAIDGEFAVEVQLADIWLDINSNGTREDWENVLPVMDTLGARPAEGFDGVIRFDSADAEWLAAYVHLLSAMSELTLAVDPTPAIAQVTQGRAALESLSTVRGDMLTGRDDTVDMIAAVLLTLRGVPDETRTRAAHGHFKAMIARNRAFWNEVARETDNDREWLPNANQASAFGVEVDAGTAQGWQDVLAEIEAILDGEALVPYWRVAASPDGPDGIGVNIEKLMTSPGDMDLILWIQGAGAAPYLERGRVADMAAWNRFAGMTRGDSLMFAVWFN